MRKYSLAACAAVMISACSGTLGILPEGAVEVTENRENNYLAPTGARYDMRTYQVPSQTPYYITVHPSGRTFAFEHDRNAAGSAAAAYIRTRGCTGPINRLSRQDVYSAGDMSWTIVINC